MDDSRHRFYQGRDRGLAAAARTHAGKVREVNQDTFICSPTQRIFAVIDGMGGSQAGEVAAELTKKAVIETLVRDGSLREALNRANEAVHTQAAGNPSEQGMGCVATVARIEGSELALAHVGDTRAYLASRVGSEQLTRDHTVVADLQEQHGMTDSAAAALPGQHRITRDIGGCLHEDLSWIDSARTPFEVDDVLLLCSDGLSDLVGDSELFRFLGRARHQGLDVMDLVNQLIELALERGAHDNVTVVAVRCEKAESRRESLAGKPKRRKSRLAGAEPSASEISTEQIRVLPGAAAVQTRRRGLFGKTAIGIGLVAAFVLGWITRTSRPAGAPAAAPKGLASSVRAGRPTLAAGEAGLDGLLEASATLTAVGPLRVAGKQTQTEIAAGAAVVLRGAQLVFPEGATSWEIRIRAGSRLELRQASIHAPELSVRVAFEDDQGRLLFTDSHVELAELLASGPEGARVEVSGGAFQLRGGRGAPFLEGPTFSRVVHPTRPADAGREEGKDDSPSQ